jgi:GT2 family glycosyltransferase
MTLEPVRNDQADTARIGVIYVSWEDRDQLCAAVRALGEARLRCGADGQRIDLAVVVNDDGPSRKDCVRASWPDATVIENDRNLGFGRAANIGARAVQGTILLFLNPDTRPVGNPFAEILTAFDSQPCAVAVAPRLLQAEGGRDQQPFQLRRLPRLATDMRELLLLDQMLPWNPWRRRDRYLDENREMPFPVEQAAAAALAVKRSAFEGVGGFDEIFFPAWFEDVDLCQRLRARGTIVYWPGAQFSHLGGLSSNSMGRSRFLLAYHRNGLRYRRRNYGRFAFSVYRATLAVGMTVRSLASVRLSRRQEHARAYARIARLAVDFG